MKNNLLFAAHIAFLSANAIYAMQDPKEIAQNKESQVLPLTLGYLELAGVPEDMPRSFTRALKALEVFWNDENSCANVRQSINELITGRPMKWSRISADHVDHPENKVRRQFLILNFPILLGSAKAARDLARCYSKKSDDKLIQMKALPRAAILQQANVNLAFIKHIITVLRGKDLHYTNGLLNKTDL